MMDDGATNDLDLKVTSDMGAFDVPLPVTRLAIRPAWCHYNKTDDRFGVRVLSIDEMKSKNEW